MIIDVLAIGAVIGGIVAITAYIPQFYHLIKIKDSTGISIWAWYAWLAANILLLVYAIAIINIPYIIVETLAVLANLIMIILTYKYRRKNAW